MGWIVSGLGIQKVPLLYLTLGMALSIVVAMFLAFHDVRVERDKASASLKAIEQARPRFVICGQKCVPLYNNGLRLFDALQLWIRNDPESRTLASLAKNVSVRLAFYASGGVKPLFAYGSQWVSSTDPENAGFQGISPSLDIPANDNPAKVFLVLQHLEQDDVCYAYSFGKLQGNPDGRYPPYRLSPGRYKVIVSLKGDNVEQELSLHLVNHGLLVDPEIEGIPKQGDGSGPS